MTFMHFVIGFVFLFAVAAYFLLFHDDILEKKQEALRLIQIKTEAEKIAKVKALSTSSKDIEKFIVDNAKTLSDATIDQLVNRIEMLQADRVIRDDDLKARNDTAAGVNEQEEGEGVHSEPSKSPRRRYKTV